MSKIDELINELAEECNRQDVNLLLSTIGGKGEGRSVIVGSGAGALINYLCIKNGVAKAMDDSDCDCEACEMAREELGVPSKRKTSKKPHIHVVDMTGDDADIDSILREIFGGDD